jgi:uncharacterized membrane protein
MYNPLMRARLWEIDMLRGIAVVAMMFFHFMWDLWYFRLTAQDIPGPAWQLFARSIGGTFTFLLGLSVVLSVAAFRRRGQSPWLPLIKRGLLIIGCGMLITLGTYFFAGAEYVRFGILHHAGTALILALLFVNLPAPLVALIGIAILALGFYVTPTLAVDHPWLLPFGILQRGIGMVDYYPLAPWFGFALLGMAAGKLLYAGGERRFALPDPGPNPLIEGLRFLGRNSLAAYLIHQPLFIAVLTGYQALVGRL